MPWSIITTLVLLFSTIVRPTKASCPDDKHWYIQLRGDRAPGAFECREAVPPSKHEPRGHEPEERVIGYTGVVGGRIYCTGGRIPIKDPNDGITIGCQAIH